MKQQIRSVLVALGLLTFVVGGAACSGDKSKSESKAEISCAQVQDAMKRIYPKRVGDLLKKNPEMFTQTCEKKKFSQKRRACTVAAQKSEDLAKCKDL